MYEFGKAAETPHEPLMTLCLSEATAAYRDGENYALYLNVSFFYTSLLGYWVEEHVTANYNGLTICMPMGKDVS